MSYGGVPYGGGPFASPTTDTVGRAAVSNTILDPSGSPVEGVEVVMFLEPQRAFDSTFGHEVARRRTAVSSATGVWQIEAPANSDLSPAGTTYRVTQRYDEDTEASWSVTLPDESTTLGALVSGN